MAVLGGTPWGSSGGGFGHDIKVKKKKVAGWTKDPKGNLVYGPVKEGDPALAGGMQTKVPVGGAAQTLQGQGIPITIKEGQVILQDQTIGATPATGTISDLIKSMWVSEKESVEAGKEAMTSVSAGTVPIGPAGGAAAAKVIGGPGAYSKVKELMAAGKLSKLATVKVGTLAKIGKVMKLNTKVARLIGYGIAGLTAVGSVVLSLWAKAEAPEPLQFISRDIVWDAKETGNWTLVEQMQEARNEIINSTGFQDFLTFVPIAGTIQNAIKKFQGVKRGIAVQDKHIENLRRQETEGISDLEMDRLNRAEKLANEKAITDYYNEQRIITEQWILEARKGHDIEMMKLWKKHKEELLEMERKAMEESAKFWRMYNQEKITLASRPSQLGFGLL